MTTRQENMNRYNIRPVTQRFVLSENTKNEIKSMDPKFGFNGLGEVVFRRTYSRGNENWNDVVIRVIEGLMSIRKEHFFRNSLLWNDDEYQKFARNMAISMFNMEWLPPGRGLWMMGTDFVYERGSMALFNCFSADTEFWTLDGIKRFSDFKDGDNVVVRGKHGWKNAIVKNFGTDRIWELVVKKYNNTQIIKTTSNHRWIAKGRKGFKTQFTHNILPGLKLQRFYQKIKFCHTVVCPIGVKHGMVFSNGIYNEQSNTCQIPFPSNISVYKDLFYEHFPNSHVSNLPNNWTKLPDLSMNNDYILGFLAGMFAVRGTIEHDKISFDHHDKNTAEWCRTAFFKLDIVTTIYQHQIQSQFNNKMVDVYNISISPENVPSKFFITKYHIEKFNNIAKEEFWTVVSATKTVNRESVWCVVEEENEEFTLGNGILTKNCAATDTSNDFVLAAEWTMDCLMNGVGVGFNTKWRGSAHRPDKTDFETYVIPDSKEGWCFSLVKLMCSYIDSQYYGSCKFPHFDYSIIRGPGLPIKGFGGQSSGPDPLIKLHKRVEKFLDMFCDGYIEIDSVKKEYNHTRLVADIFNSIGACVVAGNVRRCKPEGTLVFTKEGLKPIQYVKVGDYVKTTSGYNKVLENIDQGEQPIFVIETEIGSSFCTKNHRMAVYKSETEYEWKEAQYLTSSDMLVFNTIPIEGDNTNIVINGMDIPVNSDISWFFGYFYGNGKLFRNSYQKQYTVTVDSLEKNFEVIENIGEIMKTFGVPKEYHHGKRVSFKINNRNLYFYFSKLSNIIPEFILEGTIETRCAYLAGLFDSSTTSSNILSINISRDFILDLQSMYSSLGIYTCVEKDDTVPKRTLYKLTIKGKYNKSKWNEMIGVYSYRFDTLDDVIFKDIISVFDERKYIPIKVISTYLSDEIKHTYDLSVEENHEYFCGEGFLNHNSAQICLGSVENDTFINLKNYVLNPERGEIGWMSNNSVMLEEHDDYEDFSYIPNMACRIRDNGEPGMINLYNIKKYARYGKAKPDNGCLVNPCGEISLSDKELCNLAETFPPRCRDEKTFKQALKYATFYSSTVTLLPTHRPETNAIIAKNRRIGISISGIAQWASGEVPSGWGNMNYTRMTKIMRDSYKIVLSENKKLADEAGIPASIRVTTIKPSGSISLLAGVTPGIHYPVSRYAIRRMRIGMDSPLVKPLIEANIPHEKDTYSDNTLVFEFAIDHGNVRPCEEVSPWEQFSLMAMVQRCYSDNCVSATIYFDKEKDGPDVEKMLAMFIPVLKSVSMLPHSGHGYAQAPYEPIDKEKYEQLLSKYTLPKFENVAGNVPVGSKFCTGDKCEM